MSKWNVKVSGNKATVLVPDKDILNPATGKLKMPQRKIINKVRNSCPGHWSQWKFSDGWRGVLEDNGQGTKGYSTFILYKDNN